MVMYARILGLCNVQMYMFMYACTCARQADPFLHVCLHFYSRVCAVLYYVWYSIQMYICVHVCIRAPVQGEPIFPCVRVCVYVLVCVFVRMYT